MLEAQDSEVQNTETESGTKQESESLVKDSDFCIYCESIGSIDTKAVGVCISCHNGFCQQHRSHQSLLHCHSCFKDTVVEDKTFQKTTTKFSATKQRIITKTKTCRQISFEGEFWRKSIKLIQTLSDTELHDMIELNRASVSLMEQEILHRNIEKARQQALKDASFKVSVLNAGINVNGASSLNNTNSNTNTKQKLQLPILKANASKEDKLKFTATLKKSGITPELLKTMIAKLQAK